jgi:hypothetical protein
MASIRTHQIPYEEIKNGALILFLLRDCETWEALCERFKYASPPDLEHNTNSMMLYQQLLEMRSVGLVEFEEKVVGDKKTLGNIKSTGLWERIRVAFGGMSLAEVPLLSQHATGMAVTPQFGRPRAPKQKLDVFVLMPFKAKLEKLYTSHIKGLGKELGITIQRADELFLAGPFMEKVWDGICAARVVIADCTEKNANVFYELGIAHTVGKPVVLITRSKKDIPSDITHFDYIEYAYDPEGVELLLSKLRKFITQNLSVGVSGTRVLRSGSKGEDVAQLQRLLRNFGFVVAVDGNFGASTEVAVKQFQEQHELKPDGIVGERSWDVLMLPSAAEST